jgi:hypothetical protein
VKPGEDAAFNLTIENMAEEPQVHSVDLTGLPNAWFKLTYDQTDPAIPGEKRSGRLIITVPERVNAGTYNFDVSVMSGSAETTASGSVEVVSHVPGLGDFEPEVAATPKPAPDAVPPAVKLESSLILWQGGGQAAERKVLSIRNPSAQQAHYSVQVEGLEAAWYTVQRAVRLGPGEQLDTDLSIHPRAGALPQDYPFRVVVSADGHPSVRAEAMGWLSVQALGSSQPSPASSPTPEPPSALRPRPVEGSSPPDVVLSPRANFRFGPEQPVAQALLTVHNRSKVRERYRLVVTGIPEDWYRLSDDELRLDPGENVPVSMRLHPITGAGLPAGEYEFFVRAVPEGMPEYSGEARGVLSISGVARFDARLDPLQAQGTRKTFSVRVSNVGDVPLTLSLEAADPEGRCKFKMPAQRELGPGQDAILPFRVGARRSGFLGADEMFDFRVRVNTEEANVQSQRDTFNGRFVHHPRLPFRGVFLAGFFCALVGLVVLLAWVLSPALSSAAGWVGCQLDSDYRLSSDTPKVKKEACNGNPRKEELDRWQLERQGNSMPAAKPGPAVLSISTDAWRADGRAG